jgi:ABC-2 type transport system permease protein
VISTPSIAGSITGVADEHVVLTYNLPVGRYWRIYRTFFLTSLRRELEFRANFIAKVIQNMVWVGFFVLILIVVYHNTDSVAGWTEGQSLILAATCFLIDSVMGGMFWSLTEIPQHVRMGTLDFILTKPVDSQFWVSSRKFNFNQIGSFVAGLILVRVGLVSSHLHPSFFQCGAYFAMVFCSIAMFYSLLVSLMTLGIWLVRVDNLWVLGETTMQVARFPLDIYSQGIKRFLTLYIPLAFVAMLPARQLIEGFDLITVLEALAWAAGAFTAARLFWRFAATHYSSASS